MISPDFPGELLSKPPASAGLPPVRRRGWRRPVPRRGRFFHQERVVLRASISLQRPKSPRRGGLRLRHWRRRRLPDAFAAGPQDRGERLTARLIIPLSFQPTRTAQGGALFHYAGVRTRPGPRGSISLPCSKRTPWKGSL